MCKDAKMLGKHTSVLLKGLHSDARVGKHAVQVMQHVILRDYEVVMALDLSAGEHASKFALA